MPASSMTRADASISSSGSIVSCITPMRNGTVTTGSALLLGGGSTSGRFRDLLLERPEHVADLLVDDRLQHALAHRAHRPGDLDVGLPAHRGPGARFREVELGLHVHDRADAVALRVQLRELRRALLDLVEVDRHPQPAEAQWDLHFRLPVAVVLDLE